MKHKHYEMIVAKAANMDLVVFANDTDTWRQIEHPTPFYEYNDYFLCLPQHKKACLHWLNGGESETDRSFDEFVLVDKASDYCFKWWNEGWFMQEDYNSRIKPEKVKRVVVYDEAANKFEETAFKSIDEAKEEIGYSDAQFIEIEVEV